LGGKVQYGSTALVGDARDAGQLIVLILNSELGVGRILGCTVFDKVNLGLVAGARLERIQLFGQVGHIRLLAQHINGGLLLGRLFGQLQSGTFKATISGVRMNTMRRFFFRESAIC